MKKKGRDYNILFLINASRSRCFLVQIPACARDIFGGDRDDE